MLSPAIRWPILDGVDAAAPDFCRAGADGVKVVVVNAGTGGSKIGVC